MKANTIFSGMIYGTWCFSIVMHVIYDTSVPQELTNIVLILMSFYYGSKIGKKEIQKPT